MFTTLLGTAMIDNYSIELPTFSTMALKSFDWEVQNLQIPPSIISLPLKGNIRDYFA